MRVASILAHTTADNYCLYLTEGKNFRFDIAKTKPYKGQRVPNKPWHFDNITAYIQAAMPNYIVKGIEADDAMAIDQCKEPHRYFNINNETTIICSRDKDLKQVPGLFYSWELGSQAQFGPKEIDVIGDLELVRDKSNKASVKGTGFKYFCSQLLTGDRVDNIPGCIGVGPVAAYEALKDLDTPEKLINEVEFWYIQSYADKSEEMLLEQGQLLWIVRRYNPDGTPQIWRKDLFK